MAAQRKDIDRVALGVDYRANVKSLRTMGKEYGLAASRISQIATEEGWTRDLAVKIKEKVAVKLNASILNSHTEQQATITEKEVVEANAEMQTNIILSQRKDIQRSRSLAMKLLDELEQATDNRDLFANLGEMLQSPDKNGMDKLNDLYQKVISMPQRIDGVKKLAETLKSLVGMERQAFGITDTDEKKQTTLQDVIGFIDGTTKGLPNG